MRKVFVNQQQDNSYTVVRLVNILTPAVGSTLTAEQLQALIDQHDADTKYIVRLPSLPPA